MTYVQNRRELFSFTNKELLWVVLTALLFAFLLTFRMWGGDEFDAAVGTTNLVVVFIGMLFLVFLHEGGHKLAGMREGYIVSIEPFGPGFVFSIFVGLYSQGFLPLVTPNLVACDSQSHLQIGRFRKYDNSSHMARIALGGIVGSLLGVMVLKVLFQFTGFELLRVMMIGGMLHAVYSLIPWELINLVKLRYFEKAESYTPGDGLHILWWSRGFYVFTLVFVLIFGAFILWTSIVSVYIVVFLSIIITFAMNKALGI